ncbi:hypothetical protein DEU56DRAFT_810316 [Suillus clintonianus]|uniref:uncharacterized protein n=1 Tax=Suillus clintonianus TaxID=1904413 RepID=UPI001B87BA4E|nr:uncharacterized protein DEU56DRAFT_810316 [Suillus clintonianus]KAG2133713.1 hypothetical protein DEU56DRAFT_810316 [Suillus clintonianus]
MPHFTGVREAPDSLADAIHEPYADISLSSEEPDILISPPRSPSRLDFFHEEGGALGYSESDDADAELPISRVKWARGLFRGSPARAKFTEDDDDAPLIYLPIIHLHTIDHGTDSQTGLKDEPPCVTSPPPLQTVTVEPFSPEPVRHATLPQAPKVQGPTLVSRIHTQRLNYPHRGFSRSALLHQKSFWTARHDEWLEWQAEEVKRRADHDICAQDLGNAYTGMTPADTHNSDVSGPPSHIHVPPSGLERDYERYPSKDFSQDLNAPIYPRVGDISALRDPYSANVDRCFFRFPLWTIHKTLYVFDMHQRAVPISEQMKGSASSGSLESSTGSTTCGDEDVTLVADDEPFLEKKALDNGSHQGCLPPETPASSPAFTWEAIRAWELGWYARWELLIGLVQRDQALRQTAPLSPSTTPSGSADDDVSPPKELLEPFTLEAPSPIFHFAGEDGEGDSGDEEDDYGTLVANPIYNVDETFKEGYARAVNFFTKDRELERKRRLRTVSG